MKIKFYNPLSMSNEGKAIDYQEKIDESLKRDDCDLAKYADEYHGDSYYKKLHSCKIQTEAIGGVLYGVAVCEVDDDWNAIDTAQMKEYLEGQYSDGWGEGFEQHEIDEYEDECTDCYEDEDGEEHEYTETEMCGLYCSFWSGCSNWCIKTESEMRAESDKNKPNVHANNLENNLPTNLIICDAYNRCSAERIAGYKEAGYKVIILDEVDFFDEEASLGKITYDAEITHDILEAIESRMHLANGFVAIVTTTRELNDVSIGEFVIFFKQVVMAIASDFISNVSLDKNDKEYTYPQYRVICL